MTCSNLLPININDFNPLYFCVLMDFSIHIDDTIRMGLPI